ncbi:T9SS type A sorting domain-containing protein [Flavobacterium zepuense]|uniref:T9SS type A sorting domain-containing protein n=1 Tax=Flavobacterium zepuense TaxID=2593302 RepID=A0A552V7U3_9FLAO|nr:T9SS type A sorting domain-containing protein [Flavobacterium zepuense]TRW26543.1 T9SS type A sorting domain-containing protein [Flavobacterium zepuense]
MKKIYFTFLPPLAAIATCNAQQDMNFEPAGVGSAYTWNVFENDTNPALEFVANPSATGANTSATVAKYTTLITGNPWAGTETNHDNGMADFVLDAEHSTIKIMVYKSVISDVGIKLVTPSGAALPEIKISNTLINQWEELTFDFSSQIGWFAEPFDQIVVFPDFSPNPRTYGTITYFDNIVFGESDEPANLMEPMTAAPDPTMPQDQVISMFSGVYTNVPVDTWLTGWSSAGMSEVEIQGNPTKKYVNLSYAGVETVATQIDATEMDHFNLHVWSADFTQFRIKLVDFGANGVYDGPGVADDKEHELTFEAPAQNQWITYSIPLTDFTNLATRANMSQFIFSSNGTSTVYIDNVYFSKMATSGVNDIAASKAVVYPNPANTMLTVTAGQDIQQLAVYNTVGQQVLLSAPNSATTNLNVSQLQNGVYMLHITANRHTTTQKFIKQ